MIKNSRMFLVLASLSMACFINFTFGNSDAVLAKAVKLFGQPLNNQHHVFRINDDYVIWLLINTKGDLFEVVTGPKSYYKSEFPKATKASAAECLSEMEYEQILRKISELKEIGQLRNRHSHAVATILGPLNTDHFERAFVDRIVLPDDDDNVSRFDVFFLQDDAGSPEQIITTEPSMVCLAGLWYYLPSEDISGIRLGVWQPIKIAGPTARAKSGCIRTTAVYDANGFTIENPQTRLIFMVEPFKVRKLAGQVFLSEEYPIEAANVEFLRAGSKEVIRTKTDSSGAFRVPQAREGKYKFKVTKDGFEALSGTIILDKGASADAKLLLKLSPGT